MRWLITAGVWSLAIVFILSAGFQNGAMAQEDNETWTFMVYMSGDSSLSGQMQPDLREMEAVGSGDNLEIIVLADGSEIGDSILMRILPGGHEQIPLTGINASWGSELNMGDPGILSQFVKWTVESYPSDRLMLDLWGHGIGWPGVCPDRGDHLNTTELREAMHSISDAGIRLDIISMDACQMGQVEIAYELRHAADYAMLSQKDVPLSGWPYDIFLEHLKGEGNVVEKASAMIDSYISWGREGNSRYSLTLSLIDLDGMEKLARAMDAYSAEAVLMTGFFNPEFIAARGMTEKYDGNAQYDLVHLLENVNNETECVRLEMLAGDVFEAMEAAIVHENHWTNVLDEPADNAHGLAIWFPANSPGQDYLETDFARDTAWPEFLSAMSGFFRQPGREDAPLPATASGLDSDSDGLLDTIRIIHQGQGIGVMTTVEIYGPDGSLFHEESIGAGPEITLDIELGSIGFYKVALYQEVSGGILKNYSLTKELAREGLSIITGRVTSNAGRGLAWVGVSLVDGSGRVVSQVFTDNSGLYSMRMVVPTETDGKDLRLVCGLGSGQQNVSISTLETEIEIDFMMDVSSAYIPWAIRTIGIMNLLGLMALVYWAAWGRERRPKKETENLLVEQPIPPQ